MKNNPINIQMFLYNGSIRGPRRVRIYQQVIQAVEIPRIHITQLSSNEEVNKVGVYFLFGKDEYFKDCVYIGEAENCYDRIKQHNAKKEFWTTAVLITTVDNQLTKGDIKYLEHYLFGIIKKCGRYTLNQTVPTNPNIQDWREVELRGFTETINILLCSLGFKVLEEYRISDDELGENLFSKHSDIYSDDVYYCKGRGVEAVGQLTDEGFVLFAGSQISKNPTESYKTSYSIKQVGNIIKGKTREEKDFLVLLEDCIFPSPSAASCCVIQSSSNGWLSWKNAKNEPLDNIRKNK